MNELSKEVVDRNNVVLSPNDLVVYSSSYRRPKQVARVLDTVGPSWRNGRIKIRGVRLNWNGTIQHKTVQWVYPRAVAKIDRSVLGGALLAVLDSDPRCSRCGK